MSDNEFILLEGDDEAPSEESDPTVILQEIEIVNTDLADGHLPKRLLMEQVTDGMEDWGDGFFVEPERVLVERARDGTIVRTTPFSQIPGVHMEYGKGMVKDNAPEVAPMEGRARPTPVPLSTSNREKLVGILAGRLWRYYRDRGPKDPRYNPFRDGIPDLPAGSPEHLQPLPGTPLYPATDAQIHTWLRRFIVDRVTVINTQKFGGNTIQDIALRIE